MQSIATFRPRGGATVTAGAGAVSAVAVPAGTRRALVYGSVAGGRVAVGNSATAPTLTATNYGYLAANVPMTLDLSAEKYIYVGGTASTVFYITFGN